MERKTKKDIPKKAEKKAKKKEGIKVLIDEPEMRNAAQEESFDIPIMTDERIAEEPDVEVKIEDNSEIKVETRAIEEEKPKNKGKWLFWAAIIIIIILIAIIFNLDKIMPKQDVDVVAKVNGKAITKAELERYYNISVPEMLKGSISEQVFLEKSLIPQEVLMQEAAKMNITVEDSEVTKQLEILADSAGMTMDDLYSRLELQGIKKEDLNEMYRNKIIIEKLLEQTVLTDKEVEVEELVRASHILVDSEEKANSILAELSQGKSFEDLAKENSKDSSASRGGDLGYFSRGKMVPEFEEAAFNLSKGEVSGIVKSDFGYHIIKVTDKAAGGKMLYKDITNPIQKQAVLSEETELIQTYTDVLVEKADVEIITTEKEATTTTNAITTTTINIQEVKMDAFAACLSNKGAELYGTEACEYCEKQKEIFGESFSKINYIECAKEGDAAQSVTCEEKGIEGYPTWIINGVQYKGTRTLDDLSKMSGCLI